MLLEEAAHEDAQASADEVRLEFIPEGVFRQIQDFFRLCAVFDEVEQEEVVQVVGPQDVFRPLFNGAVVGRRQQFRADGGIVDVQEGSRQFRGGLGGNVFNQAANQRFRNGTVDRIHGHVVPVVGAPPQGYFRQVARAHHQAPHLVGQVHQNLRALAGLYVFVSGGALRRIVPDVAEVLERGFRNGDFPEFHPQQAAHVHRVRVCPVRCAEARHGHGQNGGSGLVQRLAYPRANEQGQRGVQAAGDAYHQPLGMRVFHPLGKSRRLDGDDFFTALPAVQGRGQEGPRRVAGVFQAGGGGDFLRQREMQGVYGGE